MREARLYRVTIVRKAVEEATVVIEADDYEKAQEKAETAVDWASLEFDSIDTEYEFLSSDGDFVAWANVEEA